MNKLLALKWWIIKYIAGTDVIILNAKINYETKIIQSVTNTNIGFCHNNIFIF